MISIGLLCLLGLASGQVRIDPLVSTKVGLIRGLRAADGYSKFLGIPYAVVDETNPFGPSLPHPSFDDEYEAYDDSIECPQVYRDEVTGTIQCLSLNIFVPNSATSQNRLPVMVWIHGGGFIEGNAQTSGTNPNALLKNEVILVSINYRLGIYGFLCLDTPEVPGNQGLKDQVLALRWINENIEAFGGDKTKITIFGESAGGMSVNLHLYSPYEKLFNKAIIQSGSGLSPRIMGESDSTIPLKLAEKLGYETTDVSSAVSYLATINPRLVVAAAHDEKITTSSITDPPLTRPCVEKQFEGVQSFIPEHPMNTKPIKNVPVIIGNNNNEAAFQLEFAASEFFDSYEISTHFNRSFNSDENLNEAFDTVRHFYIGDENMSEKVRLQIIDFASDFIYTYPTQRMAEQLLDSGINYVYRYMFSYDGGKNFMKITKNLTAPGATHADELGYIFDYKLSDDTPEDELMVDRLTKLWTNFVKYGDPTPESTDLLPVKWTPITKDKQHYLNIDSEMTLDSRPFHDRMAFWDLFYKLYGKYQKWYKEPSK